MQIITNTNGRFCTSHAKIYIAALSRSVICVIGTALARYCVRSSGLCRVLLRRTLVLERASAFGAPQRPCAPV